MRIVTGMVLLMVLVVGLASAQMRLRLATTTSTDNSGLLGVLLPVFEQRFEARVDVIAVGTGRALKLGEKTFPSTLLIRILRVVSNMPAFSVATLSGGCFGPS